MASSDDEGEMVPNNVSDYEFLSGKDEPVSFSKLPVEWNKDENHHGKPQQIFLSGKTDNGLRKIYKQATAWKFDLSRQKPEVSVLSADGYWIKLLKPRKAYHEIIRTIQITLHILYFVKWNPQKSQKALWDHLDKAFSLFEKRPSEEDLKDHLPLINEALERDETLASSKLLHSILEEKLRKRQYLNEEVKPSFIVDDADVNEDQESDRMDGSGDDEDDEDDEDDCFDSVCAICDNGGRLFICDGKCMRSFHATEGDGGDESKCETLGLTEAELEAIKDVPFYCKNCEYKQHQCFACGELGSSDESSGAEVFCCVNGACGYFYHPYCVAKLLHPRDKAAAEEHGRKIAAGEQFTCPAHKCHACKELEVRLKEELQFAVCRRCPRAYHRQCLPREIALKEDADERGIIARAWDDLIPSRLLIYCLEHEIDEDLLTPVRDHIRFPGPQRKEKRPLESSNKKNLLMERNLVSEDSSGKRISAKPPKGVDKMSSSSKQGDLSRKRVEQLHVQGYPKKQKLVTNRKSLAKPKESRTDEGYKSLGDRLYDTICGMDSEPENSGRTASVSGKTEISQKVKPTSKCISNSVTLDPDSRIRIFNLMKEASSSITLDQVKQKHKSPSTHTQYSKCSLDNITLGKVEGAVQALRAALKKLDEGGSVLDAKAVFGNDLLSQVDRWKDKLKVYLAPFLYGMRYTSFGRHFTKNDKLKEIVDMLHWYMQDGDMLVDFCCGSNDFSCLMKKKLDEVGKRCSFKNYDILQAKNDFNFERRDWMTVRPKELPDGSQLVMGLNPPFGINAALANKFINKALEFKPKLLILIVPRETERLDEKSSRYDLILEDDQMFVGKSFYLPGSVDVNDKQIEDWNVNAPVLYLWSRPDATPKHKAIAEKHGDPSGAQKNYRLEESQNKILVNQASPQECQNLDESPMVNQAEEKLPDKSENHEIEVEEEEEEKVTTTTSLQETSPHESRAAEGDKNRDQAQAQTSNNHSEKNSNKRRGKRKRNKNSNNNTFVSKTHKHSVSPKQVHSVRDDYQRNLSTHHHHQQPHPQTQYNGNNEPSSDDLILKYRLNNEPSPHPHHNYSFNGPPPDPWMASPQNSTLAYTAPPMSQEYERDVNMYGPNSSWSQRGYGGGLLNPSSQYGLQTNPNPVYGGMMNPNPPSAMQRYASRLDEMNHGPMNMVPGVPPVPDYHHHPRPPPRPAAYGGSLGFAPAPHQHPYPHHHSTGWLNE